MSLTRTVRFEDRRPDRADIEPILRNFLGGCGTTERMNKQWILNIPGKPTSMFLGIKGAVATSQGQDERWIEVDYHGDELMVTTRTQDDFTNALADCVAEGFGRFYGGKLDMGD